MKKDFLRKISFLLTLIFVFSLLSGCTQETQETQETQGIDYPSKTITMVSPYGAGGGSDLVTRVVAKYLEKYLNQTVIVNNVTGQSGVVGGRSVKDADPNGYTLLTQHSGMLCLYHSGLAEFSYKDFSPVAFMVSGSEAIAVNAESSWNTIEDLIDDAKSRPGEISYGFSVGGTSNFLAESIMNEAGIEFKPVTYDGESERGTALAGGHVDVISGSFPSLQGYVDADKVRILGVVDTDRNSSYPDIPTLKEQGLNVTDSYVARGIFAPKGLPEEIMSILVDALEKVSKDPDFAKDLAGLSYDPRFIAGDNLVKYLDEQDKLIDTLAKEAGMK
ncbi:MAG: tripartite tricarboxylate transporter substrate binding protein [Bacilli bacterium]|nr:tripartite tricarboxylate transporter substrate binding protein [Bacilli bacterium]